jgi:hypothetical protein
MIYLLLKQTLRYKAASPVKITLSVTKFCLENKYLKTPLPSDPTSPIIPTAAPLINIKFNYFYPV